MKIITILSCRPQFIKSVIISEELKKSGNEEIVIHTGQHYDYNMSDIFFKQLGINRPKYNLGIGGHSHGRMTGLMFKRIESVLVNERPDLVLVYGDTNSTLAGSLCAVKLGIPVAHVEAGLRSFDKRMPEEVNRIVTDRISDYLFCPNTESAGNLAKEGIHKRVYVVGDVMYDVLLRFLGKLPEYTKPRKYYYVTIHRQENTIDCTKLNNILHTFDQFPNDTFVLPLHPRTAKFIKSNKIYIPQNVVIEAPQGYIENLILMRNAHKIITDSGGIQKEAYMLGVPCITLRSSTEWKETVSNGWNVLVDCNEGLLKSAIENERVPHQKPDIFGDGEASKKIVKIIGGSPCTFDE